MLFYLLLKWQPLELEIIVEQIKGGWDIYHSVNGTKNQVQNQNKRSDFLSKTGTISSLSKVLDKTEYPFKKSFWLSFRAQAS